MEDPDAPLISYVFDFCMTVFCFGAPYAYLRQINEFFMTGIGRTDTITERWQIFVDENVADWTNTNLVVRVLHLPQTTFYRAECRIGHCAGQRVCCTFSHSGYRLDHTMLGNNINAAVHREYYRWPFKRLATSAQVSHKPGTHSDRTHPRTRSSVERRFM